MPLLSNFVSQNQSHGCSGFQKKIREGKIYHVEKNLGNGPKDYHTPLYSSHEEKEEEEEEEEEEKEEKRKQEEKKEEEERKEMVPGTLRKSGLNV